MLFINKEAQIKIIDLADKSGVLAPTGGKIEN